MTVRLEVVTHIAAPIGVVFDESVTWKARHFGVPFTMTSEITELDSPRRFVDAQVRGPFRTFCHVHQFSERHGTTRMVDHITFEAPIGPIGRLAERLVLRSYLTQLIETRNEHLRTVAESHT